MNYNMFFLSLKNINTLISMMLKNNRNKTKLNTIIAINATRVIVSAVYGKRG